VIWLMPIRPIAAIRDILHDHGVGFVAIDSKTNHFPGAVHSLSWSKAFAQGLREWKRAGIGSVLIPCAQADTPMVSAEFTPLLARTGLRHRLACADDITTEQHMMDLLRAPEPAVYFHDDLWCSHLALCEPQWMAELFARKRVLLSRTLRLVRAQQQSLLADLAYMDWNEVARRVVEDVATRRAFDPSFERVFEAKWRPRVDLHAEEWLSAL
jgi:hypothetical protein